MVERHNKDELIIPFLGVVPNEEGHSDRGGGTYSHMKISLIKMGFREEMCDLINLFFEPQTLEDAINLMTEDVNGVRQHNFIEGNGDLCLICNSDSDHLDRLRQRRNYNPIEVNQRRESIHHQRQSVLNESRDSIISLDSKELSPTSRSCRLCYEEIEDKSTVYLKCKHYFCNACWVNYFTEKISGGTVKNIHCMESTCRIPVPAKFVLRIMKHKKNLIEKYKKFTKRDIILNNPKMKFCPYPNCDAFAEKIKDTDSKYVKCSDGHEFCFNCLKMWHGKSSCENEIDADFEKWKKDKVIKQCPKCHYWTEKNLGCNHMTCRACGYNWCWLCQQYCPIGHYDAGTCSGLQFKKSEEEIKQERLNRPAYEPYRYLPVPPRRRTCCENAIWNTDDFRSIGEALMIYFTLLFIWIPWMWYEVLTSKIESIFITIYPRFDTIWTIYIYVLCFLIGVSYQLLGTCLISFVLIPSIFYWPLMNFVIEKAMDIVGY